MKGLTVPGQLILGSGASLGCDYNLEGSKLYSVKWYKDGQEFFRFMPSMDNKIEVFSVRGVHVEVSEIFIFCWKNDQGIGLSDPGTAINQILRDLIRERLVHFVTNFSCRMRSAVPENDFVYNSLILMM